MEAKGSEDGGWCDIVLDTLPTVCEDHPSEIEDEHIEPIYLTTLNLKGQFKM